MSRAAEGRPSVLPFEAYRGHALPGVADVVRGAPALGVLKKRLSDGNARAVGDAVQDIPSGSVDGLTHIPHPPFVVGIPIVFQIVNAPGSPLAGIGGGEGIFAEVAYLFFTQFAAVEAAVFVHKALLHPPVSAVGIVARRSDMRCVGGAPGPRINAELKSPGMQ